MKTNLLYSFKGSRILRGIVLTTTLLFLFFAQQAKAFALLGPFTDWMTMTNGFMQWGDVGGPMDINEGYRWNVPVVTYAFDQSFVDAFGSNGVASVEGAIQILNNLPPASQMDLSSYPLITTGMNFVGASKSLVDLKSTTLCVLVQQLGLAQPGRFVYCVHDFSVTNNAIFPTVLQRNFDPISLAATNIVNGATYKYDLSLAYGMDGTVFVGFTSSWSSSEQYTAVADQGGPWGTGLSPGSFFAGLTRDDAGGLRYLLGTNNYKFEPLLSDVHGSGTNTGSYVNVALRAGIDKITFVRQDYDPILQIASVPVTNQFIDTYVSNNVVMHQQLERVVTVPDFLFTAVPDAINPLGYSCTGASNWLNNSASNGNPSLAGPGIIRPPANIAFQYQISSFVQTGDQPGSDYLSFTRWGSFDASTNVPVEYPVEPVQGRINTLEVQLQLEGNPTNVTFPTLTNLDFPNETNFTFAQRFGPQIFDWELPVPFGHVAAIQTSTNLVDWTTLNTITNYGSTVWWINTDMSSHLQKFFRVIPQE